MKRKHSNIDRILIPKIFENVKMEFLPFGLAGNSKNEFSFLLKGCPTNRVAFLAFFKYLPFKVTSSKID